MLTSYIEPIAWRLLNSPEPLRKLVAKWLVSIIWRKKSSTLCTRVSKTLTNISDSDSKAIAHESLKLYINNILSVLDIEREAFNLHNTELITQHKKNGGVLATLHMGKVDAAAFALKTLEIPVHTMINPRNNKPHLQKINHRILHKLQLPFITNSRGALFNLANAVNQGQWVFIHSDLKGPGVNCKFLGRQTEVISTAPTLAVLSKRPLFFCYGLFLQGQHHVFYEQLDDPCTYLEQGINKELVIQLLTQRLATRMETLINDYPEQWYWMYKRFK